VHNGCRPLRGLRIRDPIFPGADTPETMLSCAPRTWVSLDYD